MEAPPGQLLVLLWHHAIYYKRHWMLAIWEIIKPIFIIIVFDELLKATVKLDKVNSSNANCEFLAEILPTHPHFTQNLIANSDGLQRRIMEKGCVSMGIQQDQHKQLQKNETALSNKTDILYPLLTCKDSNLFENPICLLLYNDILFYPKNKETANLMAQIDELRTEVEILVSNTGLNRTGNTIGFDNFHQLADFATKRHADVEVTNNKIKKRPKNERNSGKFPSPPMFIWGAVSFENMAKNLRQHVNNQRKKSDVAQKDYLKYSLIRPEDENELVFASSFRSFALQEIIDWALLKMVSTNETHLIPTIYKRLVEKCWDNKPLFSPASIDILLIFLCVATFLSPPAVFLSQILVEKQLKLREYMAIMGVNPLKLKFSWIIFYSLWLIPLSIIFAAVLTKGIMVDYFAMTNHFFVYLLLIGYNINMLGFCFMLSNFFQTNKHSSTLLYLIHMVVAMCTVMFGAGMTPTVVWISRLMSLHPLVPMSLGLQYIAAWEDFIIGASWSNLAYSPVVGDTYGGLLEALIWTFLDIWIYMLLAWYLEKVMPGEYGQKQPFYFPFSGQYWNPEEDNLNEIKDINADVEPAPNQTPGVIINGLTKTYEGGEKVALNKLELVFYENEITAFLGHNGAGKSTTMNCLVGLITPSSGRATVNGFDINTQMNKIQPQLGYVPQYDILYPDFTVEDHLKFFGWIKGLSTLETQSSVDPMIESLDMGHLKTQTITNLSGGQKRKLSIITGYLGNPKTIIFDEPTSGVDPFSRRSIWKALLKHKSGCTTVLSTHFMDEADLLGDRIAIINEGKLKCSGSPIYLKNKYGRGYRLDVTRKENVLKETIINFITGLVPDAQLNQELGVDMEFSLTKEMAHSPEMILKMEEIEANADIVSYGISEPTIEDVFFTSIKQDYMIDTQSESKPLGGDGKGSNDIKYEKGHNFLNQFLGLTKKRFISSFKSHFLLVQNCVPLMFVILLSMVSFNMNAIDITKVTLYHPGINTAIFIQAPDSELSKFVLKSAFKNGHTPLCPGDKCDTSRAPLSNMLSDPSKTVIPKKCSENLQAVCQFHCENYDEATENVPHEFLPSKETLYRLSTKNDLFHWVVLANQSDNVILGGFTLHNRNKSDMELENNLIAEESNYTIDDNLMTSNPEIESQPEATVHYQMQVRMAMLNLWNTYRLRQITGTSLGIEMSIKEEKVILYSSSKSNAIDSSLFSAMVGSIFLTIAFTFSNFGVIYSVSTEKTSGLKRLQLLNGANPFAYWLSNLVHDYAQHLLTSLIVTLPLLVFDSSFDEDVTPLTLLVSVEGLQSITFVYLLVLVFHSSTGVINLTMMLGFVSAIVTLLLRIMRVVGTLHECRGVHDVIDPGTINGLLSGIPIYLLGTGISYIASVPTWKEVLGDQCDKVSHCDQACDQLDRYKRLAPLMGASLLWAMFYFILVLLIDYFDVAQRFTCLEPDYPSAAVKDEDVLREAERLEEAKGEDNLIVRNLKKCFRAMKRPAVSDISFGVHKGETFGLLGINGAGKTTTFNMLTGFERPTSGSAFIKDVDLFSVGWFRFENSSYCPQENTLFPSLTIEQHFSLFGALRGISLSPLEELAETLIMEVGLDDHRGKKACELSGGNQRKLQLAIALIDYKPVIFLDEPTSGMDPQARRKTWSCVGRAVKESCSVVLTSHSMEECEALCHRLVIMVDGAFTCIGSVDYLKHKFGDKIILNIKVLSQGVESGEIDRVCNFVTTRLPSAILKDQHSAMLQFHVQRSNDVPLSRVHKVMQEMKCELQIEDVSVKLTTLEQVFINLVRAQEEKETHDKLDSLFPAPCNKSPAVTESSSSSPV